MFVRNQARAGHTRRLIDSAFIWSWAADLFGCSQSFSERQTKGTSITRRMKHVWMASLWAMIRSVPSGRRPWWSRAPGGCANRLRSAACARRCDGCARWWVRWRVIWAE